jgi:hypothetical protein
MYRTETVQQTVQTSTYLRSNQLTHIKNFTCDNLIENFKKGRKVNAVKGGRRDSYRPNPFLKHIYGYLPQKNNK